MNNTIVFCILLAAASLLASQAKAVSSGQLDDFQNGTTANWENGGVGNAVAVTNVSTGGPAGAGDRYIRLTADGSGAGGKLTAFNRDQWLGDYNAAGVTSIEVDLRNESTVTLSIRMAFKTGPGSGGVAGFLTRAVILAPGSGWQHVSFSLAPANLTAINNPGSWANFFIGEVRFIHEVNATNLSGDNVVGQLGIDNVRAVPEPATAALLAAAALVGAAAAAYRRRALHATARHC